MTSIIEEIIVKFGINTSDPFFRFNDFTAISNAAVPLAVAMPNFFLCNLDFDKTYWIHILKPFML